MCRESSLTERQRVKLIQMVKIGMAVRGWKVKDLAREAGYSERAIYALCCANSYVSNDCICEVMRVLDIRREDLK